MTGEIFYAANIGVLGLAFLVLMVAGNEAGFRLGKSRDKQTSEVTKSQISSVEAGILGILGLLLGFTMSMAVARFEVRKRLVLDEANAIGTAHLRTQLLPAEEGKEIADLLRAYTDLRVPTDRGDIYLQITTRRQEAGRLQDAFWKRAAAYGRKDPNPVRAGLLLQALNDVIDLDASRWMAFQNHVPETVIFVIAAVGLLAAVIVGYTFGLAGGPRQLFSNCMLSLAIMLVLTVIIDLDRSFEGFIRVSQQPMIDLQKQLHSR